MKKFINNNDDFLKESLTGFGKAHSDIINVNLDPSFVSVSYTHLTLPTNREV